MATRALGIALIRTFAVVVSFAATLPTVLLFGWLLLFAGAIEVGYFSHHAKWSGILLNVVNRRSRSSGGSCW